MLLNLLFSHFLALKMRMPISMEVKKKIAQIVLFCADGLRGITLIYSKHYWTGTITNPSKSKEQQTELRAR